MAKAPDGSTGGQPDHYIMDETEQMLASELKKCYHALQCRFETADTLFQLGSYYHKKAVMDEGVWQKRFYVWSSALMNGAKKRFSVLGNTEKVEEVNDGLRKLGSDLLRAAKSEYSVDLLHVSQVVLQEAQYTENLLFSRLSSIPWVRNRNDTENCPSQFFRQDFRDENINSHQLFVTCISEICQYLLGPTAEGISSIKTVTKVPSFAFPHHISVSHRDFQSYAFQKSTEYLEWYSLLFRMITINFGKTSINSVGVGCLTDFADPENNWFQDMYYLYPTVTTANENNVSIVETYPVADEGLPDKKKIPNNEAIPEYEQPFNVPEDDKKDSSRHIVDATERNLTSNLKSLCTLFGKESPGKLEATAEAIFQLGKHHLEKTKNTHGPIQRLSFIRSSVLLNGAKKRFAALHMDSKLADVDSYITQMGSQALLAANCKHRGDFDHILGAMREPLKRLGCLKQPAPGEIPRGIHSKHEDFEKEYIALLNSVSSACIGFLGPPPSKYALIGNASLMQRSATPFAACEQYLVFEGADPGEVAANEFFAWHLALFQMAVMGLGETPIHMIEIEGLSNANTSGPLSDRFYDIQTPSATAVAEHCSIKQEMTSELPSRYVYSVDELANIAARNDDAIKNLYSKATAKRPCLIDGDEVVLHSFRKIMESARMADEATYNLATNAKIAESFSDMKIQPCVFQTGVLRDTDPNQVLHQKLDGVSEEGDPNFERIDSTEEALASRLRELCTPFGKEPEDKLSETAFILFQLGQHYLRNVQRRTNMLQKLTIIRASALLNGAKTRFKTKQMQSEIKQVNDSLAELGRSALSAARAAESSDLVAESAHFFERVGEMRKVNRDMVSRIPIVTPESDKDAEKFKIYFVQQLIEKTTEDYKSIMKSISEKCLELLGPPPCRFAAVGLGSLARREITPFSDYEHVLILEEGVQYSSEYDNIREYFRWYSVLSQLIMINFGETFVRSVGVKSLNDLYVNDPNKNWYYDVHTTCGIAFDGMAPQACSNPLGRQVFTEKRRHVLELIQPVSEMVKFLSSEADIKNGYYVKDLIACTCYVHGNLELYEKFSELVRISPDINLDYAQTSEMVLSNINPSVRRHRVFGEKSGINVKASMYRPVVTTFACHARSLNIRAVSTLDVIDEMLRKGCLSKEQCHDFRYTVAMACEVRMKVYLILGNQRHKVPVNLVVQIMGKQSFTDFHKHSFHISHLMRSCVTQKLTAKNVPLFSIAPKEMQLKYGACLGLQKAGLYHEALELYPTEDRKPEEFFWFCCEVYIELATSEGREDYHEKCIEFAELVNIHDESMPSVARARICYYKACSEKALKRNDALRETVEAFLGAFGSTEESDVKYHMLRLLVSQYDAVNKVYSVTTNASMYNLLLDDIGTTISTTKSLGKILTAKTRKAQLYIVFGNRTAAQREAEEIFSTVLKSSGAVSEEDTLELLKTLLGVFKTLNCIRHELACIEVLENWHQFTGRNSIKVDPGRLHELRIQKIRCHLRLGELESCLHCCQRYLRDKSITKRRLNAVQMILASTRLLRGKQFYDSMKSSEAIEEYKAAVLIYRRMELNGFEWLETDRYAWALFMYFTVCLEYKSQHLPEAAVFLKIAGPSARQACKNHIEDAEDKRWRFVCKDVTDLQILHANFLHIYLAMCARMEISGPQRRYVDESSGRLFSFHAVMQPFTRKVSLLEKIARCFLEYAKLATSYELSVLELVLKWAINTPDAIRAAILIEITKTKTAYWNGLRDSECARTASFNAQRLLLTFIVWAAILPRNQSDRENFVENELDGIRSMMRDEMSLNDAHGRASFCVLKIASLARKHRLGNCDQLLNWVMEVKKPWLDIIA